MNNIKQEIRKIDNLSDLNSLRDFISECKIMLSKSTLDVGSCVWVVQKTKRTEGVITKMNRTRAVCLIGDGGMSYNVPFSIMEAA